MRKFFIFLLLINILLFCLILFFPNSSSEQRDTEIVAQQVAPSMVVVVKPDSSKPAPEAPSATSSSPPQSATSSTAAVPQTTDQPPVAAEVPQQHPAAPPPPAAELKPTTPAIVITETSAPPQETLVCRQVSNLSENTAISLRDWLKQTNPSINFTESREGGKRSWIVLYPPSKNAAQAQTAANQLKKQGVPDLFIITQAGQQQHGISLGVFSSEAGAKQAKTEFEAKGISPLSIYVRDLSRYQFKFSQLTSAQKDYLERNPQYLANGLKACR